MKTLPMNLRKNNYGIDFVLKAVDSKHEVFSCVLVDGNKLIGCDGKRLHIYEDDIVKEIFPEPGVYKITIVKKETFIEKKEISYPEYLKVIPEGEESNLTLTIEENSLSISKAVILLARKAEKQNFGINFDYVSDLSGEKWNLITNMETAKTFKLVNDKKTLTAVIMPIELK